MDAKLNRRRSLAVAALAAWPPTWTSAWAQALPAAGTMAPPPALLLQNVPAVPVSLANRMAAYTEFRGHVFLDWHPTRAEMLVGHRAAGASTTQLFRLGRALGDLQPVTQGTEPASAGTYEPAAGRYIVFSRSTGGNEVTQLFRQGLDGAPAVQITHRDERNELIGWRKPQGELVYTSLPIDRTAQGGSRAVVMTTFWAVNPEASDPLAQRRKLMELEGGGWYGSVSEDGLRLALTRYISANESQIWVMDLQGANVGKPVQLLPKPGTHEPKAFHDASFSPDGQSLLVVTDRFGEFRELAVMDLKTHAHSH